ncbi:tetratricopeptide repeat protein [Rhodocytophaga rosea]|uniref:Tetratricopeptide repeat protein n=1 Tax=Rhodocytophaga rosea TaxID=2704465 RepID=A0A6C0GJ06_9BACT|nr:tetratricopeptide repeat protein [Rhodocytophaga rosea]QHT67907.1 tetratricopeptide repeat protein [Rhodocytophaga rosea]
MRRSNKFIGVVLKITCVGILLFHTSIQAQNQDIDLANQYLEQKEYEKAKAIFQKIIKRDDIDKIVYKNYLYTLQELKEWNEVDKYLKRHIKNNPEEMKYKIDYAFNLQKQGKENESEKYVEKLIDESKKDLAKSEVLASALMKENKLEWAEKVYLEARKNSGNPNLYALQIANLYKIQNNTIKMIEEYINLAMENKNNLTVLQNVLQDNLTKPEEYEKLEQVLISRIQKEPTENMYSDLLIWYYIQQKDFNKAFFQARSMDKRMKLEGSKLTEIGMISLQNKDYKSASTIYEYLVKEYPQSPSYPIYRRYLIMSREELVKNTFPINRDQIQSLIVDYQRLIGDIGKTQQSAEAMRNMAVLYGFYLDNKDTALFYLKESVKYARQNSDLIAKCKIDMGDIYLLKNEPWEATLLYSQVEKSNKEQPIGYEAKLKNAKLSYYKGEFELAQGHLDILKLATSREIANDAMDLSLLIQDNLAMDTVGEAMKEYASAELLLFQNKDQEALRKLEAMNEKYKGHSLSDEILWLEAQINIRSNENLKAVEKLEKIVNNYGHDILGDDAHFMMAKLLEEKLNDKEKAMELYQNHLIKYPGSIYSVEARKRFRQLRGDRVN